MWTGGGAGEMRQPGKLEMAQEGVNEERLRHPAADPRESAAR